MGSYGNNVTISQPGEDWAMLWPDELPNFQLDIVGFLAILGEASILANAQVSALSRLFYLPRLLPAPQALLRVSRPETLPSRPAHVTAAVSGNNKNILNHVASVLLATHGDQLKKWSVRCIKVTKTPPKPPTTLDHILRGTQKQPHHATTKDGQPQEPIPATVKAKAAGPVTWVTLLAVSLTVGLFITSICLGDGMSLMALVSLSLLSTICGIANKWELNLPARPKNAATVKDDKVVIRFPEGSFLVVICNDEIARELFFAPEEISYTIKSSSVYRVLALVGSIMLMLGVILLANARLQLQIAWALVYVILNAAHWAAAALPAKMHWDLSCYHVQEEGIEGGPESGSFTEALYKVISVTKRTRWVSLNEAAPSTDVWAKWIRQARAAALRAPDQEEKGVLEQPVPEWNHNGGHGVVHRLRSSCYFDAKDAFNKLAAEGQDDDEEASGLEDGEFGISEKEVVIGAQEVPRAYFQGHAKALDWETHDKDDQYST